MSWGGAPPGQNPYYGQQPPAGGYGQGAAYRQPPPQYGGAPPGGAPPAGYGGHPPQGGAPPAGYGGHPPPGGAPPGGYGGHPPPGGSAPPPNYGAPPPGGYAGGAPGGYGGAPPPGQYGGAPAYGAPPPGQQPYGQGQYRPPGGAPPPHAGGYGAPPAGGYAAPPPPGVTPEQWGMFQAVDQDRSGKINALELQQALHNGNWTPFNNETCRLMIGMFDRDKSGTIDVHEFAALWKYIQDWKACFERFDNDRSGSIAANELQNAFQSFGYSLSPQFCQMCVRVFNKSNPHIMNFDDFIQCCVMLKSLTDAFRAKDAQQRGVVNIQYEEFLRMVMDNTLVGKKKKVPTATLR